MRENKDVCKSGNSLMELAVQRLVVLLPVDEKWDKGFTQAQVPPTQ